MIITRNERRNMHSTVAFALDQWLAGIGAFYYDDTDVIWRALEVEIEEGKVTVRSMNVDTNERRSTTHATNVQPPDVVLEWLSEREKLVS